MLWLLLWGWAAAERPWSGVKSFCYQLQGLSIEEVERSGYELLVTDYSRDGSLAQRFTRDEVARLQQGPRGRRLVLAYLSIGEAESYRFYWKPGYGPGHPAWLEKLNPEWEGNYKVRYWLPGWQKVLYGSPEAYLDQILAAGFDGVYLDIIDGYEYFQEKGRPQARQEMIDLVCRLALYARSRGGADFGIFPQNGEELLTDKRYLATITGIGREDLYFGNPGDGQASPADWTKETEATLRRAVKAKKLVLNIDYTSSLEQAEEAYRRARRLGIVEFVGPRKLNRLPQFPGLQPPP